MDNKVNSLETIIDLVIEAAEDKIDLEKILSMLEDKVNKVDMMITDIEEQEEE